MKIFAQSKSHTQTRLQHYIRLALFQTSKLHLHHQLRPQLQSQAQVQVQAQSQPQFPRSYHIPTRYSALNLEFDSDSNLNSSSNSNNQQHRHKPRHSHHSMPMPASVPTTSQVQPGATVSIVLKADQRTGREVQGKVSDVLTRGNHPRGIKVRLQDGRIGRVQRMFVADDPVGSRPSASESALSEGHESHGEGVPGGRGNFVSGDRRVGQRPRYSDVRIDGYEYADRPAEQIDLMAYTKPARGKRGGNRKGNGEVGAATDGAGSAVSSCPVCGKFQGDEAALAHHVNGHFED